MSRIEIDTDAVGDMAVSLGRQAAGLSGSTALRADPHCPAAQARIEEWSENSRWRRSVIEVDLYETAQALTIGAAQYADLEAKIVASHSGARTAPQSRVPLGPPLPARSAARPTPDDGARVGPASAGLPVVGDIGAQAPGR